MENGRWRETGAEAGSQAEKQEMAPVVSIIVPVYQSEQYLRRCVDSLLGQTWPFVEVILVDDGSRDRSLEICQEYAENDDRVKVIHKENGGVASARNAGLRAMTGDYLMLIDADDYIDRQMTERLVESVRREQTDMAVCGFQMVYEDGRPAEAHSVDIPFCGTFSEFVNGPAMEYYDKLLLNTQSNKLYSAAIQKQHQIFYNETMAINEDLCFSLEMMRHCGRISCVPGDFLYYWQYSHPQSLVTRFNENGVETCFVLLQVMENFLRAGNASADVNNQMNNRMIFHICGFAGLPYYRSDWQRKRCYEEIVRLTDRAEFQELLRRTRAKGVKNQAAKRILGHRWCRLYHLMCLVLYGRQRRQKKRNEYEQRSRK